MEELTELLNDQTLSPEIVDLISDILSRVAFHTTIVSQDLETKISMWDSVLSNVTQLNQQLQNENFHLKMENDFLKKYSEAQKQFNA